MEIPFQNTQIDIGDIPTQTNINFIQLEKSYLRYGIVFSILIWLLIIILANIGASVAELDYPPFLGYIVWSVVITLMIANVIYSYFSYFREGYALRQKDIIYKNGLFWRSVATIPFSRIQHCEVKEGPIQRMFGIASLHVYTAGGNSSDIDIPGLNPGRANELKQFVLTKIKSEEEE